jgi:hypothetical protein
MEATFCVQGPARSGQKGQKLPRKIMTRLEVEDSSTLRRSKLFTGGHRWHHETGVTDASSSGRGTSPGVLTLKGPAM